MRVEVRVEFCQQSCVLSTVSFKRAILWLTQVAGLSAELRSWVVLFPGDTWALGKPPPEEGHREQTLPFRGWRPACSQCLS